MTTYHWYMLVLIFWSRWSSSVAEAPDIEVPVSSTEVKVSPTSETNATVTDEDRLVGNDTNLVSLSDSTTVADWSRLNRNGTIPTPSGNGTDNSTTDSPKPARYNPYAIINQGTVSKKQYETCSLVINIVLKPVICVGGAVMNIIGFCVLLDKRFRRSTYTYLSFLALGDVCLLLVGVILTIPKVAIFYDDVIANYIDMHFFPYVKIFLETVFTRMSEYIICALAIERFVAVLRPLKVKDLFLCRHALAISMSIFAFCTLFHVHFMFIYYPKPYFNPTRNITMYALGTHPWYSDTGIKPVYNIIYEILFLYLPLFILVTCNIGILIRVRQMNKQRRNIVAKNEQMNRDERRMTLTLMVISLTFLAIFLPLVILTIIQKFHQDIKVFGREHYLLYLIIDVLTLGWNISSANDFIVYIYTSKQFKKALADLLCRNKFLKANLHKPTRKSIADNLPQVSSTETSDTQKIGSSTGTLSTDSVAVNT